MIKNDRKIFNIGDYIGDHYDRSWRIKEVTEKAYVIVDDFANVSKEIYKGENPSKYAWQNAEKYANNYCLLRPNGHEDIEKYPIGSVWRCNKKCGLNDPKKDTVNIVHYAYSDGVFWVCNSEKPYMLFIADAEELLPIEKTIDMDVNIETDEREI